MIHQDKYILLLILFVAACDNRTIEHPTLTLRALDSTITILATHPSFSITTEFMNNGATTFSIFNDVNPFPSYDRDLGISLKAFTKQGDEFLPPPPILSSTLVGSETLFQDNKIDQIQLAKQRLQKTKFVLNAGKTVQLTRSFTLGDFIPVGEYFIYVTYSMNVQVLHYLSEDDSPWIGRARSNKIKLVVE